MASSAKPIPIVVSVITIFLGAWLLGQGAPVQRIRVSERVSQVFVIKRVQPKYPQDAKQIEGSVVMKAEISKEGDVTQLDVVSGHPLLIPAALDAAKQWKYKPYLLNKQPVEVETQITLDSKLH
jgi:periplasmic protein TonB